MSRHPLFFVVPLLLSCTAEPAASVSKGDSGAGSAEGDTAEPVDSSPASPADFHAESATVTFGAVAVGAIKWQVLQIHNLGGTALTLRTLTVSDTAFNVEVTLPAIVEPGASLVLPVGFAPTEERAFEAEITVEADDAAGAHVIGLSGTGVGDAPVAVCAADPPVVAPVHETASFLGDGSVDPLGDALAEYAWTLVSRPMGSGARLGAPGSANIPLFQPDLAGTYIAELVVTDRRGRRSSPCRTSLTAIPSDDLWVEMYWTEPGDDMDLHLVQEGGTTESDSDCYYANCNGGGLDWGVLSDGLDDPALDLDDIAGVGPENINIEVPADGSYTVVVRDYAGSTYEGANPVTVKIYVDGLLAWTDTREIGAEGDYLSFATIDWPSGVITGL